MIKLLLFLLLGFSSFSAQALEGRSLDQLKSRYRLIISGGGPGGLMAALTAIGHGVPANEILIVEKRIPGDPNNGYATRDRVVVLDSTTVALFHANGVELPGTDLKMMGVFRTNGDVRYFPNKGIWRRVIEQVFGGRSLQRLSSLREIEQNAMDAYIKSGGHVVFGETINPLESRNPDQALIKIGSKSITSDLVAVFEGASSTTAAKINKIKVAEKTTSHFLSVDLPLAGSSNLGAGEIFSFTDPVQKVMIYAFSGARMASVNMMLPPGVTVEDLDDLKTREYYQRMLISTANRYGLRPRPSEIKPLAYSGTLSHLEAVMVGNYVFGGETLRTVDAISGTGANSAASDGYAIGRYFSRIRDLGKPNARQELIDSLAGVTAMSFGFSLFYREMGHINLNYNSLVDKLYLMGLSNRDGMGSLLDISKGFNASLLSIFTSSTRSFRDEPSLTDLLISEELKLFGVQPPDSISRLRLIGPLHPSGYMQNTNLVENKIVDEIKTAVKMCRLLFKKKK